MSFTDHAVRFPAESGGRVGRGKAKTEMKMMDICWGGEVSS